MFKFKIISSIVVVAMMVNFAVNLKLTKPEEEESASEDTDKIAANIQPQKIKPQSNRSPASKITKQKVVEAKSEIARYENSNFVEEPVSAAPVDSTPAISGGYKGYQAFTTNAPASIPLIRENVAEASKTASASSPNFPVFPPPPPPPICPGCPPPPPECKPPECGGGGGGGGGGLNTCTADIAGGAFSNPIGVTLSCSSISTIKYCFALDTGSGCCDPLVSGTTYSSKVIVGPTNGNYCLSYYGVSASAVSTDVYHQSYTINSTLPNLAPVTHSQIYYQSTQLAGRVITNTPDYERSFISSTDYGKTGYGIGQINLKTHDPGIAALNLDCEQIVTNSLTVPAPLSILALFDVSLANPALPLEIPLQLNQLAYGDNFITSYIENANFVVPIYACSTSKIVLNDFEFFQEELAFGDPGTNSVREFTGGLSPFGFFEAAANVYRGPAGVNTVDNSGQKLEYGMFGIFY
ncbi:MAG: hypothetical protein PHY93_00620 [Bacteriovorax sp.]|nr:hypothetical protein [Bacteriovorax sp.]